MPDTRNLILKETNWAKSNNPLPKILQKFKFKTDKKNQLVAFFKPEAFLEKSPKHIEKILDLVFNKLEKHGVNIDGSAIFPGPSVGKYSIMDKHYGVINTLSKSASKILSKDERELVYKALGIKNKNTRILGGHEAFEISKMGKAYEFDNYWLESPSTKIKSGFYIRTMKIGNETVVVVNGFHPQQLSHFTEKGRNIALMLVSSNTPWHKLRTEMIGDTFPNKAVSTSIRGTLFKNAKDFGFEKVGIDNNVIHLSAGPTEALFEMDNFLHEPFGHDIIKEGTVLATYLKNEGFSENEIKHILTDKVLHNEVEHKDTDEAVKIIKKIKAKK